MIYPNMSCVVVLRFMLNYLTEQRLMTDQQSHDDHQLRIVYLEVMHMTAPKLDNFVPNYNTYVYDYDVVGEQYDYQFNDHYEQNAFGQLPRMKLAERLSADGWELVTMFEAATIMRFSEVLYSGTRFAMIFKRAV